MNVFSVINAKIQNTYTSATIRIRVYFFGIANDAMIVFSRIILVMHSIVYSMKNILSKSMLLS